MNNRCVPLIITLILTWGFMSNAADSTTAKKIGKEKATMALTLTSTAFKHEGLIPPQFTCDGADSSPALAWTGAPEATKTFAIICDDPDAPMGTWVHWVVFNIPADARELKEKFPLDATFPNSTRNGINSWKRYGYGGPCPPSGTHRYFFRLYALDTVLKLGDKVDKEGLLTAMKGHILATAELMGKYSRK